MTDADIQRLIAEANRTGSARTSGYAERVITRADGTPYRTAAELFGSREPDRSSTAFEAGRGEDAEGAG